MSKPEDHNDSINKADRADVMGHLEALNTQVAFTPDFTEFEVTVRSGGGGEGDKEYGLLEESRAYQAFAPALERASHNPAAGEADVYPGADVQAACDYFGVPVPPADPQPIDTNDNIPEPPVG